MTQHQQLKQLNGLLFDVGLPQFLPRNVHGFALSIDRRSLRALFDRSPPWVIERSRHAPLHHRIGRGGAVRAPYASTNRFLSFNYF